MTPRDNERLSVLETQMAVLIEQVRELKAEMRPIAAAFQQRKGALWVLFMLGSAVGALVAAAANLSRVFGP